MRFAKRAAAMCLALSVVDCSERATFQYGTAREAVVAGTIERGWLPSYLPNTSRDIVLRSDIDTNEMWAVFMADTRDIELLKSALEPVLTAQVRSPGGDFPWPDVLQGNVEAQGIGAQGLVLYRNGTDARLFAIEEKAGRVYCWRAPS